MKKTKIAVLIPVNKRLQVLEVVLKHWQQHRREQMAKGLILRPFFICSSSKEARLCRSYYFGAALANNDPLGAKMNEGLRCIMSAGKTWDYLMTSGSDDLLSPEIWEHYRPYIEKGEEFFGVNNLIAVNPKTLKAKYCEGLGVFGAARMIKYEVLQQTAVGHDVRFATTFITPYGWGGNEGARAWMPNKWIKTYKGFLDIEDTNRKVYRLWPPKQNSGLDTGSENTLNAAGYFCKNVATNTPFVCDIKGFGNIHRYEKLKGVSLDFNDVLQSFPQLKQLVSKH
jgi:hypothetical protein